MDIYLELWTFLISFIVTTLWYVVDDIRAVRVDIRHHHDHIVRQTPFGPLAESTFEILRESQLKLSSHRLVMMAEGTNKSVHDLDSSLLLGNNRTIAQAQLILSISHGLQDLRNEWELVNGSFVALNKSIHDSALQIHRSLRLDDSSLSLQRIICMTRSFTSNPCPLPLPQTLMSVVEELHVTATGLSGRLLRLLRKEDSVSRDVNEIRRETMRKEVFGSQPASSMAILSLDVSSRLRIEAKLACIDELKQFGEVLLSQRIKACTVSPK
ncbi:hypothetical protein PLICRDRAFT_170675 [Plicaturopsis crispa FD-325 SS-3]|nr:hypothetical protein PLICRDRAFT_170675 [Plicaturopsis crispa FD-325 SS-3]